jgi:N-acetylglucosamine-6-phosphate deacetylase
VKGIIHGKIITEQEILKNHVLIFEDKIVGMIPEEQLSQYHLSETIDARGRFVSPGFIDVHVHGCSGFDTMDDDTEALSAMSKNVLKAGVTSFLPTSMTMKFSKIDQCMARIRHAMGNRSGAEILGCHMEGPFINEANKGAQDPQYIIAPEFEKIKPYLDVIKIITVAPEVIKDDTFIAACAHEGVIVSIGHSSATYEQAVAAIVNGASHMTHTFNVLPPLHHRKPGAVVAAMESDSVVCELIADNVHVHPAMQRLLLKMKGVDKLILITDALRAAMLCDGTYDLGGQMVVVDKGVARLSDGALAGSVLLMNQAVKNFRKNTNLDLMSAVKLVTVNPARQLGILAEKGSLKIGKHADVVVFDDSLEVFATIVRGNILYRRKHDE